MLGDKTVYQKYVRHPPNTYILSSPYNQDKVCRFWTEQWLVNRLCLRAQMSVLQSSNLDFPEFLSDSLDLEQYGL